jgi:hypothetical protein
VLENAPVTGRLAGRHRGLRGGARRPRSLLLMDYPAGDGPFADYRVSAFVPAARRRTGSAGRNRVLAVVLACVAATAMASGVALSRSSATVGRGDSAAAPGHHRPAALPQPSVTSRGPVTTTTAPPQRARRGPGPRRRLPAIHARSAPAIALRPSPSAAAGQPAARRQAVMVTYLVASQGAEGFQGEIQVTNNTDQPIGNWQIVVALDDDAVTSFTNATGYFSNGILLLGPSSPAQVAPPDGGVLDIFFVADGTQTTPTACAFNGTSCLIP